MESNLAFYVLLVTIPGILASDACLPQNREDNLDACLEEIREVMQNKSRFWFGTAYGVRCPNGWAGGLSCFSPVKEGSIASALFWPTTFTPNTLDRYLDVSFTSEPGSYTGCDYKHTSSKTETFSLDPLSLTAYTNWVLRTLPAMSWTHDSSKQYTLVFKDVGYGITHGLYVNIPGDNVSQGKAAEEYSGPKNNMAQPNVYAILLYEQQTLNMDVGEVWLGSSINVSDLATQKKLKGPVAVNWMIAEYDPYGTESIRWSSVDNCAAFIRKALPDHNRPFLGNDVTGFLSVHMSVQNLNFRFCCKDYIVKEETLILDPIGNQVYAPGRVRSGTPIRLFVNANKLAADNTTDFKDGYFTMLSVDPDIPSSKPTVGTKTRPLLHWFKVNLRVQQGELMGGRDIHSYRGPMPPDDQPHTYYFILYRQKSGATSRNTSDDLAGDQCSPGLQGKCLFNVQAMVADMKLEQVAVNWMQALNDDFVNRGNRLPEAEVCKGRAGYDVPCPKERPTSAANARADVLTAVLTMLACQLVLWMPLA